MKSTVESGKVDFTGWNFDMPALDGLVQKVAEESVRSALDEGVSIDVVAQGGFLDRDENLEPKTSAPCSYFVQVSIPLGPTVDDVIVYKACLRELLQELIDQSGPGFRQELRALVDGLDDEDF